MSRAVGEISTMQKFCLQRTYRQSGRQETDMIMRMRHKYMLGNKRFQEKLN